MELKINNKLLAYKGCIGRREYILNLLSVNIVSILLTMPFSYWIAKSCQNPMEMFNFSALLAESPVSVMFFYVLACLICITFHYGLVCRRIADIKGVEVCPCIYLLSALIVLLPYFWLCFGNLWLGMLLILMILVGIALLCIPGKISSQLPSDELKRFNWGAFWGTWIWGLFNKSYITLLMIPLLFTPASLTWMIICGIKGNEWAFKNTKTLDREKFHKGQKNQAIFWNSFAGFMIFIFPFLLVLIVSASFVSTAVKNPEKVETLTNKLEIFWEDLIIENFEDYYLDIDENKFYVDPVVWVGLTFEERYDLLKGAASYAAMKKMKSSDAKFEGYSSSRSTEMSITKIYSSYNGEVLAEFDLEVLDEVKDFKSAIKASMKAIKFNTKPQLPPDEEE